MPDDLVTIDRFLFLPDAEIARATLEAAGIDAVLIDENTVRMSWGDAQAHGGIRLQVRRGDAEEARDVLAAEVASDEDQAAPLEEGDYEHCHRCGSAEIYPAESRSKTYARILLLAGGAFVLARFVFGMLAIYGIRVPDRAQSFVVALLLLSPAFAVVFSAVAPKKRCRNCGLEWRGKQRTA